MCLNILSVYSVPQDKIKDMSQSKATLICSLQEKKIIHETIYK